MFKMSGPRIRQSSEDFKSEQFCKWPALTELQATTRAEAIQEAQRIARRFVREQLTNNEYFTRNRGGVDFAIHMDGKPLYCFFNY